MITVTGTITSVKMLSREPYMGQSRYSQNSFTTEEYLRVSIEVDGNIYVFNTVPAHKTVTVVPGHAVVTFQVEKEATRWMEVANEDDAVAVAGRPNRNKIEPLVRVGQEVAISGRQSGNRLTHVKRIQ